LVQISLDSLPAFDLGGEDAVVAERPKALDQILPPADQGAARTVLSAASLQDPPGRPLADPERLLDRPPVDPLRAARERLDAGL
jgi:hypothetical protein